MGLLGDVIKVGTLGLADPEGDAENAANAARAGARNAADAQLASTEKNIDFQKWLWGEQKELSEPFRAAGTKALGQYADQAGKQFTAEDMMQDPGYQFRLNEGMKGIENSAAAKGMQLSGRTLKGIGRYAQDYASNEFQNAYARRQQGLSNLYNLASMGQAAAAGQAQQGGMMGGNVSQSILQGGQAQADMYMNMGNIGAQQAMAPWNSLMQVGQLGAMAYGAKSDIRLKKNIKRVGTTPKGIPVYNFSYKWDDVVHTGVMAQEVLDVIPEAVFMMDDGYYAVDYSRIQ